MYKSQIDPDEGVRAPSVKSPLLNLWIEFLG